jgi:hypothetical protein
VGSSSVRVVRGATSPALDARAAWPNTRPVSTRTFDRDEVEAILRVALQRAEAVEGLTREELAEVAAEVGIPLTDLDGAIELIEREREVDRRRASIVGERKRGFYAAVGNATIATSFLGVIDYVQGPGWWVPYVAAVWGMVLTFRGRRAFFADEADLDKLARKQLQKEWKKRDWQKRERQLPKAVEAGAAALIEAAARKIAERIDAVGVRPASSGPRVRVAPSPAGQAPTTFEEHVLEQTVGRGRKRESER